MTAICGGGTSGPKAGVVETVIFTSASIASILNNKGGAWATLVAPMLGVIAYQAEQKCLTDPPADPGMTGADYQALLNVTDWAAFSTALGKLATLAEIAIWYEVCECKTITTPAAPTAPFEQPEDVGVASPVGAGPCYQWSGDLVTTYDDFGTSSSSPNNYTIVPFPKPTTHLWTPSFVPGGVTVVPRQTAWNSVKWKAEVLTPYAGQDVRVRTTISGVTGLNSDGRFTIGGSGSDLHLPGSGGGPSVIEGTNDWSFSGWSYLIMYLVHHNVNSPVTVRWTINAFCGAPSGYSTTPCSPDPATLALLQQIYQLLTIVQRQHVPFAVVPGLEYLNLSGNGEITFSDPIVRAKVTLTTLPAHYGMAEGSPDAVFDVGRIALGTAEGYGASRVIASTPFVVEVPSDVTRIGYSLGPGVVARIDTFAREP